MDINVTGAKIYCYLFGNQNLPITETLVNTWIAMIIIVGVCIFLTHSLSVHPTTKRQIVAEYLVGMVTGLVHNNMGKKWSGFIPFIAAIFSLSAVCNLMGLTGAFSPTGDLNTLLAWALLVFILITYWKIKANGFGGYLKGYLDPIPVMLPMNIISEVATPISMAFRHFGNIASGTVITLLLYAALEAVNKMLFGLIPGVIGEVLGTIPILATGIPAVLEIYFGVFSGLVQPFIFCMLTMLFIARAGETEEE
ncbi:MAG: F0F1 ATP synthase subunit A [Butyricicoccus sp.]